MTSTTAEEILVLCTDRKQDFDALNAVAALNRMAKCKPGVLKSAEELLLLSEVLLPAVARFVPEFWPRALANAVWAMASLQVRDRPLLSAFAAKSASALRRRSEPPSEWLGQELANLAWGFASLRTSQWSLFQALSHAVRGKQISFRPQGLANTAWAFAAVVHLDLPLTA